MVGGQPYGFRVGDSAELFAEFIIGRFAFTTRVPRTEDVGHDLLCSLFERSGALLKAGPFFTVQVKSKKESLIFEKKHEIEWIKNQENPFFVCIVSTDNLHIDLYSTWNRLNAFSYRTGKKIELIPGDRDDNYKQPEINQEGEQKIPLGRPILSISLSDAMSDDKIADYSLVLNQWIIIDRQNIVNKTAGMYWVLGPQEYETNKIPLRTETPFFYAGYWHAQNLQTCIINFYRCATALRVVTRAAIGLNNESKSPYKEMIIDLEQVLKAYSRFLDPLAKKILKEQVGLIID